ncbi:hypothetical protein AALP_AA6G333000 [Arabis alpina]|uniref:FKB95-like N-terminal Kelch domain-containing protein n=1 Tax=Arabis alpina TaxID=50452 RepID=A0A087GTB3_ARAAL|nr:hypothetical protein AALP_AA6G333000 [Arabis alpina]
MCVEREYPAANVFDGRIYVTGGCKESDSSNWMEVYDPETGIWECVLSPEGNSRVHKSAVIDGTIYNMFGNGGLAYKPKEDKWETIGGITYLDLGWPWLSYCVVDNVLYCCCNSDGLKWYDSKRCYWMDLKGLKGLPKFAGYGCVKLADYGGKLAVFWTKYFRASGYKKKRIWCAVIVLERRNNDEEIWGNVEWFDPVLTVPNGFHFVRALAATV